MSNFVCFRAAGVTFVDDYPHSFWRVGNEVTRRDIVGEPQVPVHLRRNPLNPHDTNAIELVALWGRHALMVGHVPADLAEQIAPRIDSGEQWSGHVLTIAVNPKHPDRPGIEIGIEPTHQHATGGTHMGTALDTGLKSSGPPAVKLPTIGASIKFAVVDVDNNVPVYVYGKQPPLLDTKADGTPKTQIRLTVLVIESDGALIGSGDDQRSPEPGDVVSIYVSSYGKWDPDQDKLEKPFKSWSACIEAAGLEVGYVGMWRYVEDLPSNGAEPRKNRKFVLRADRPDEAAQQQRCEELHKRLRREAGDRTELASPTTPPAAEYSVEDF